MADVRQSPVDDAFDIDRGGAVAFSALSVAGAGLVGLGVYEAWSLWTGKAPPVTWMVRASSHRHPAVWAAVALVFGSATGLLAGHFFWGGYNPREGAMMP